MNAFGRTSGLLLVILVGALASFSLCSCREKPSAKVPEKPSVEVPEKPSVEVLEKPSAEALEKQAKQLEAHWKAGKHAKYFVDASCWTMQLREAPGDKDMRKVAAEFLASLLDKEFKISDIARTPYSDDAPNIPNTADLQAMEDLVSYFTSQDSVPLEERKSHARLLARCLGKVRTEMVPNFKRKPATMNVMPPVMPSPEFPMTGAAGMDPNDIDDPVARAAYIAAIQVNEENHLWNQRQQTLNISLDPNISRDVIYYLIETFRGEDGSSELLNECMKIAKLSDKEKKIILERLRVDPGMNR